MATLKNVGTPAEWDSSSFAGTDLVDVDYINSLLASNMTMQQAQTQYNAMLSAYAPASFLTAAINGTTGLSGQNTSPLATSSWAAAQVANYQTSSTIAQPSGPVPLQYGTGQVSSGQIATQGAQTVPAPFWSPGSYLSTTQSVAPGNNPTPLFSVAIPALGYPSYKLVCFGSVDVQATVRTFVLTMDSAFSSSGLATFTLLVNGVQITDNNYHPMNLSSNTGASAILSAMQSLQPGTTPPVGTQITGVTVTGNQGGPFTIAYLPLLGDGNLAVVNNNPNAGSISVAPTGQPVISVVTSDSQTVAQGYGLPSVYQGSKPGSISSQMTLNTSSPISAAASTIGNWVPNPALGFTSTVVGNFLQVPQSGTVTLTATLTFTGASEGSRSIGQTPQTSIQIIKNDGTVLVPSTVTGATFSGTSGTLTCSGQVTVTQNELIGVQGWEPNIYQGIGTKGTYGTWQTGTLTLTAPSVYATGEATVVPTSLAAQTAQTTATTLTVYLSTVGNLGGAQANPGGGANLTPTPGLWVMPVPWS